MLRFIFAGLFATAFNGPYFKPLNAVANASYAIKDLTLLLYHTYSISQYYQIMALIIAI